MNDWNTGLPPSEGWYAVLFDAEDIIPTRVILVPVRSPHDGDFTVWKWDTSDDPEVLPEGARWKPAHRPLGPNGCDDLPGWPKPYRDSRGERVRVIRELDVTVPFGGEQDAALFAASFSGGVHRLRVILPPEAGGEIEGNFFVAMTRTAASAPDRIDRTYHLTECVG